MNYLPRDAGALYDLVGGQRRYALIADGRILDMAYHAEKPDDGREWLSVTHEDSEPFDLALHFRLKPEARIEDNRVVVAYPVVPKAMEHA